MSLLVPARRPAHELLDDGGLAPEEMARSLRDLELVNRRWGGAGALVDHILTASRQTRASGERLFVLDVGAGSGGVTRFLAERLAEAGVEARVAAVDLQWRHLAAGRAARGGLPAVAADVFRLPFPDRSSDFVVSTLVFHHFSPDENGRLIREIARVARVGFAILDLRRHLFPWIFVSIAGRVVFETVVSLHDGRASVLQAYTPDEAEAIATSAVPESRVRRVFPYRMLITGPGR